jgi:phosphoenolpyruvate---glycerone phosphotransferase subunit DhaK
VKKLINQPADFVDETIEGILAAHPDQLKSVGPDLRALVRADAPGEGRVGIVTGGGSGHLPLFLGYVGRGLASGVAIGNVFSSPSSEQIFDATMGVSGGAGVLHLFGNYSGDVLNFELAADLADAEGVEVRTVITTDDVTSAPADERDERRGVAGMFFAYKCAGAAAETGATLDEVEAVASAANAATRSMGVGLSPTILPAAGEPTFTLEDGEMEIGIGIHGEPGIERGRLRSADEIVDQLLEHILGDLPSGGGDDVAVLVNGMGATPKEELYVLFRRVHQALTDTPLRIHRAYVGEYATSLEMAGASLSVMRLDDRLTEHLDAPARSPFFEQS